MIIYTKEFAKQSEENRMFQNKRIIITGGANGIGRCIAQAFLSEGAFVTVIDIDKESGETLQRNYKNLNFFHGDIAEKEVLEQFVQSINSTVNCLINNAGIGRGGLLSACTYEDFEYVQRVGLTAPYYLVQQLVQNNLLATNGIYRKHIFYSCFTITA